MSSSAGVAPTASRSGAGSTSVDVRRRVGVGAAVSAEPPPYALGGQVGQPSARNRLPVPYAEQCIAHEPPRGRPDPVPPAVARSARWGAGTRRLLTLRSTGAARSGSGPGSDSCRRRGRHLPCLAARRAGPAPPCARRTAPRAARTDHLPLPIGIGSATSVPAPARAARSTAETLPSRAGPAARPVPGGEQMLGRPRRRHPSFLRCADLVQAGWANEGSTAPHLRVPLPALVLQLEASGWPRRWRWRRARAAPGTPNPAPDTL